MNDKDDCLGVVTGCMTVSRGRGVGVIQVGVDGWSNQVSYEGSFG